LINREKKMEKIKIYLNANKLGAQLTGGERQRKIVEAELIKENEKTVWVKLPDGRIIARKKSRDIVEEK